MRPTDTDDDEEILFITLTFELKLIRLVEDMLIPSKFRIKAEINPTEKADDMSISTIMAKIRFWFDSIVSKSIAFSYANEGAYKMLIDANGKNQTSNILLMLPGDPTDDLLAAVFQSKMTALSKGLIEYGLIEVKSDNPTGLSFTFVGEGRNVLPPMDKWMVGKNYFDKPWWARDDASTLDVVPPEGADLTQLPLWAFSLDSSVKSMKPEGGIILKPEFRPTVIDGGKKGK